MDDDGDPLADTLIRMNNARSERSAMVDPSVAIEQENPDE
jgi:hypothetical protein